MFDIGFDKLLVLAVIVFFVVGPKRLPELAARLGRLVRWARQFIEEKKSEIEGELGAQAGEIEWRKLDPRQYDPRRIVRDALFESETTTSENSAKALPGDPGYVVPVIGPIFEENSSPAATSTNP